MFLFKNKESRQNFKGLFFNQVSIGEPGEDGFVKIVPIGKFPVHPNGPHEIIPRHIREMEQNFKNSGVDLLFDFDHESLWGNTKAAGWSSEVQAREDGLYVKYPEFTPAAQQAIQNREYRYFSPVYRLQSLNKAGEEVGAKLISVALTNTPYMDNEIDAIGNSENLNLGDKQMLNKEALALLGLAEDATPEQVQQAIAAQTEKINSLQSEIDQLKQNSEQQKTALEDRLKNIEQIVNSQREKDAEQLIEQAINDGKILPADKAIWINAAKADYDATAQQLSERKKNSAMPHTMPMLQDKDGQVNGKKNSTFLNAVEYMKSQGRMPLLNQKQN